MSRSCLLLLIVVFVVASVEAASAQQRKLGVRLIVKSENHKDSESPRPQLSVPHPVLPEVNPPRSKAVPLMYVNLGVLAGLDVYTTSRALSRGAVEANPVVAPFAHNPVGCAVVKAVSAAGTILLAERLRKKSPTAAIVLLAVVNGVTAAVVAQNMRVARTLKH